jgi:hypothetical protein
MTFSPVLP